MDLLPNCYGRLNMKTHEIEDSCICEITAMLNGWRDRFYDYQDLLILYAALPTYQVNCKHPPKYEDFIKNRPGQKDLLEDLSIEELKWLAEEE